ncbi:MAG: SulP family inorganic anion transporter [Bacteroidia bacterium]|nr:SulP family inorganic anion transporter [Bacteroidia bacterium]
MINKTRPAKGGLSFATIKQDFPAGLVVFLVALPLCLGIALASGAPLFSGLISGIVGGIVVSVFSGSQLAVSGPAAGLTVIVLTAITEIGSYQGFLVAVVLAGILQIILGFLKAGTIGKYFPSSVIKGMLAAIGIILIIKQIPHALGYDADYEGDFQFIQNDTENSFTALISAVNKFNIGAVIISVVSMVILIGWDKITNPKLKLIPGPLFVVVIGIVLNMFFQTSNPLLALNSNHLVSVPITNSVSEFFTFFTLPDFSFLKNPLVYKVAITLALIASIETLLSLEAIDKIDPHKRDSPSNQELKAQGIGNIISGFIGGLPITAVIVRGSVNVNSGAQSKMSSFIHGILLLLSAIFIPKIINLIPYASLAAILLVTGYKLTKISIYKNMYKVGFNQFIPFIVTIVAIVFTDLLVGIGIGLSIGIFFILKNNMMITYTKQSEAHTRKAGEPIRLVLTEEVSFLNKASILATLEEIPVGEYVVIDGSKSRYIDYDVLEVINDFKETAKFRNIKLELIKIKDVYRFGAH